MAEWILEGDIKACFDRISHDWLLANIPTEKAILRKWQGLWSRASSIQRTKVHLRVGSSHLYSRI